MKEKKTTIEQKGESECKIFQRSLFSHLDYLHLFTHPKYLHQTQQKAEKVDSVSYNQLKTAWEESFA